MCGIFFGLSDDNKVMSTIESNINKIKETIESRVPIEKAREGLFFVCCKIN